MSFWVHINEEIAEEYRKDYKDYIRESGSRAFYLTLGLEPMDGFTFKYVIVAMLNSIYCNENDHISVSYFPVRSDKLAVIQASRPQCEEAFHVEVDLQTDKKDVYKLLCKKSVSLNETISLFYKVLVKFETPDTSDWYDITDLVRYFDD